MSLHDYGEDALIEQPAIRLFEELGWETVNCFDEVAGSGSFLSRETRSEVVLVARLRPALRKLNPGLPPQAIDAAIEALTRDLVTLSPARANQAMYQLIKNGVSVRYQDRFGEEAVDTVQVIDWENPLENDFFLASQLWITGELYTRRTDLVGFVNGLPLVFVELKASHVRIEDAYHKNLCDYRDTIPQLFRHNAFVILSNGSQSRVGSTTASWEHFADWKKIDSEREPGIISLETMIRGTCEPARLLDIVENFTLFSEGHSGLEKIVGKNHQVLGVNNALHAARQIDQNRGKLGVFWHTQGAGKSYSMLFFAQKVLRTLPGHWTFVIVTDRVELDDQIYKTFARAGAVTEPEEEVHARSADHLRGLLGEDHRYIFTLVHKFRTERGQPHPVVSERPDIIVITDEAHRTSTTFWPRTCVTRCPRSTAAASTPASARRFTRMCTSRTMGRVGACMGWRRSRRLSCSILHLASVHISLAERRFRTQAICYYLICLTTIPLQFLVYSSILDSGSNGKIGLCPMWAFFSSKALFLPFFLSLPITPIRGKTCYVNSV